MLVRLLRPLNFLPLGGPRYEANALAEFTHEDKGYGRLGKWWIRPDSYVPHIDMDELNEWASDLAKDTK